MTRRVLLVGATGAFGSRLAHRLAAHPHIELVLAARSPEPLEALRRELAAVSAAAPSVMVFDRTHPEDLSQAAPWLVIDAAGPFQGADYRLASAAIAAGANYIDLADARAFVAGFPAALHDMAARRGVLAVTGASSTPALSHAVLERLVDRWTALDRVTVAIAPGARAPRGLSVMQAILSYAGHPVRVFRAGGWSTAPGWSGLRRLDMPGLGRRWLSLCETPDLDLLPQRFPIRREATFLAGLELAVMHLGLAVLALPVRWGLISTLRPMAGVLRRAADLLSPLGSDRGGMIVAAEGRDGDGRRIRARWGLWADANAGPNVPIAATAALVRALVDGRCTRVGATACVGLVDREAILHELASLPISTRTSEGLPDDPVLFRRVIGGAFEALPPSVRLVHGGGTFRGHAVARTGQGRAASLMRRLGGWARSGHHDVEVEIAPSRFANRSGERWVRRFGGDVFASRLFDAPRLGAFEERFGPLAFLFDLEPTSRGVRWRLVGWSGLRCPLPLSLAPKIKARGDDVDGRYRFTVVVRHRCVGLLFAYRGWLRVTAPTAPTATTDAATPADPGSCAVSERIAPAANSALTTTA